MSDTNTNTTKTTRLHKGSGKSTTYGGDGKILCESTGEGKSSNTIRSGDNKGFSMRVRNDGNQVERRQRRQKHRTKYHQDCVIRRHSCGGSDDRFLYTGAADNQHSKTTKTKASAGAK